MRREFTEPRFPAKGFYHPIGDRPGTAVASSGFLLEEGPLFFDPALCGITYLEAETLDASQQKLLEVDSWELVLRIGDVLICHETLCLF